MTHLEIQSIANHYWYPICGGEEFDYQGFAAALLAQAEEALNICKDLVQLCEANPVSGVSQEVLQRARAVLGEGSVR